MDNKIELNTVLYTKDGRVAGNAIVSEVCGDNTFQITTDYGNVVRLLGRSAIENWFKIGDIASTGHKNFTAKKELAVCDEKVNASIIKSIGSRFNTGKTQWGLVDFESLEGMVKVLEFGANKYGIDNWQKGLTTISIIESMLRHIFAFMKGNDIDSESKLPHTDHIMCNAMFLAYMWRNKKQLDNRKEYNNENN